MKTIYQSKAFALDREGIVQPWRVKHPINDEDIQDLVSFIKEHLRPIRGINRWISAYGLKQPLSRYLGRHIYTGEMIRAMQLSGFKVEEIADSGNARFNVSPASVLNTHKKFKNLQWQQEFSTRSGHQR